jgi:hypothetical protein
MAEKVANRPVPDTTVLRAIKSVMSEVAANSVTNTVTKQDLVSCLDRICPVFRSFKSAIGTSAATFKEEAKPFKDNAVVIQELYDEFDLNEDQILMPDELFLLLRRACDHSGFQICDIECMELFRLVMEQSMLDKDGDELLDRPEVERAFDLVFRFYNQMKSGTAPKPPGKGPPGKGPPMKGPPPAAEVTPDSLPAPERKVQLMDAFDLVDEDGAGIAPRLDLRKKVDSFIPQCAEVQALSDAVRGVDAMILERDEYEEIVDKWLSESYN